MREAPFVEQFAQQNSNKVRVFSIGFGADLAASRDWAQSHGLATPTGFVDDDSSVAFQYNMFRFPGWLMLDSSGKLIGQGSRFNQSVQDAVDAAG